MSTEKDIQSLIRLALGKNPDVKIFRNISSMVFVGRQLSNNNGIITLGNAHQIHAGLFTGASDLIGWKSLIVTPEMVGSRFSRFVSLEVKSATGKLRPEQVIWLDAVHAAGGIADVVRSPEEALEALK
jgi:hypothetical protein